MVPGGVEWWHGGFMQDFRREYRTSVNLLQ